MSVRAVLLLGIFLVAAGFVHGGLYAAGHDFVVNRFTGTFQFVPSEEEDLETVRPTARYRLTAEKAGVRFARSGARRGAGERARVGR